MAPGFGWRSKSPWWVVGSSELQRGLLYIYIYIVVVDKLAMTTTSVGLLITALVSAGAVPGAYFIAMLMRFSRSLCTADIGR